MGLQDPMSSVEDKYTSSLHASCKLIGAVMGEREFSTTGHIRAVKAEWRDGKKYWDVTDYVKLQE